MYYFHLLGWERRAKKGLLVFFEEAYKEESDMAQIRANQNLRQKPPNLIEQIY